MTKFFSISIILFFMLIIGFVGLIHFSAWNSKDCSQFVIDSYEVRSGIDIPAVDNFNCYYDKQQNLRLSVCTLKNDLNQYLKRSAFKPTSSNLETILTGFHLLSTNEITVTSQLYMAEGRDGVNYWKYVVEKETGRMWIEMQFN